MGAKNILERGRFCPPLPPVSATGGTGGQNDRSLNTRQLTKPKEMIMKRIATAKNFAITIAALALGAVPGARAEHKVCSEEALKGAFAYTSTGFIVTAPIPALVGPSAEVGTQYFDGKGNVTFSFNSSQNGNVGPGTATGAYTLNTDDCTGTFTEITPMFTSHFSFAIDQVGDEFRAICQDTGVVVTRTGRRQFPERP
jgi:hypothetical protein